jgi:hypothetical protein
MVFNYRQTLRDEAIAKKPVDNGVSTSSFGDAEAFRNAFVARMKDTNIDPNKQQSFDSFSDPFSNEKRNDFITNKEPQIRDGIWNSEDPNEYTRADDFRNKYVSSRLVEDDKKVTPQSALEYVTGQPNDGLAGKFPTEGVTTT